ncbi:hypothetical protein O181_051348 [Austropuccinia psidii MF-1]|uniref:Uncharacterized protein n=1 Tax=Austropuccinia psidii MF-1 TaxID=1389203 RepID=A0A9Q3E3H6_9BASI|nr:hypothetical protein [Austropuccinia psidii MF-1]
MVCTPPSVGQLGAFWPNPMRPKGANGGSPSAPRPGPILAQDHHGPWDPPGDIRTAHLNASPHLKGNSFTPSCTPYSRLQEWSQNPTPILKEDSLTDQSGNQKTIQGSQSPGPAGVGLAIHTGLFQGPFSEVIHHFNQLSRNHSVTQFKFQDGQICIDPIQTIQLVTHLPGSVFQLLTYTGHLSAPGDFFPTGGINVTINTQEIQSTIETPQNAHTPCVRSSPNDTSIEPPPPSCDDVPPQSLESNSSPPSHAPTPGLNNLNQEFDFQTQNPPTLEETQQSPISQPASPPNVEFSIFSNEFCPQFFKIFQMFNSGQLTQAKY